MHLPCAGGHPVDALAAGDLVDPGLAGWIGPGLALARERDSADVGIEQEHAVGGERASTPMPSARKSVARTAAAPTPAAVRHAPSPPVSLSLRRLSPGLDNPPMKTVRLRPGKERSLLRRHPWIFESAIAKGGADPGETVRVESHDGSFLAWAAFSPASQDPRPRLELRRGAAHRRRRSSRRVCARGRQRARRCSIAQRRRAAGARRVRRPAGPDRRPLRRHAGGAVPVGRRRALEGACWPTRCWPPPACTQAVRALGRQRRARSRA